VTAALSARLREIVDALPLRPGLRILEIGCGPGAMAREIARRLDGNGFVLAIDRSATAIRQAEAGSAAEIAAAVIAFRQSTAEAFGLLPGEQPFDLAVAIRVGALDGRHPEAGTLARAAIKAALIPKGRLLIDGGDPLREVDLGP
jgi:cyclopropane fatty-acyl-phospholipid synthase-like methyltransferase